MLKPKSHSHAAQRNRIDAERRFANANTRLDDVLARVYADPREAKEACAAMALEGEPQHLVDNVTRLAHVLAEVQPGFEHHLGDLRVTLEAWFSAEQALFQAVADTQSAEAANER